MPVKKTDQNKPWALKSSAKRNISIERKIKKIFLIYCEGENTEPEYFRSFPVNTETKIAAIGLGRSRTALVTHIIELARDAEYLIGQRNYDEDRLIWCVFDKDTKGEKDEDADFNEAIRIARESGLEVAYSNDSFELWFYLHFNYVDAMLHRKHYYKFLSDKFAINYEKDGKSVAFSKSLYELLLPFQKTALKRAERLHQSHKGKAHCDKNPCTTVYKLVEKLNESLR